MRLSPACMLLLFLLFLCVEQRGQELEAVDYTYPNGQLSSQGFMLDGKPEGYWKTYYETGVLKSEGNREDFLLSGEWKFYREDGSIKESITYVRGKKNGTSAKYDSLLVSRVTYVNDTLSGLSYTYFPNGNVHKEIPFERGLENGKGYEFSAVGDIVAIMKFKDGFLRSSERINRRDKLTRKQGIWKEFYEDRTVRTEGVYVDDVKNGLFKVYDEKGQILSMEKYVNGELDTEASETTVLDIANEYYPDGKVKVSGSYKEGKKHGVFREFDEDGVIMSTTVYVNGEAVSSGIISKSGSYEGEWSSYHENGNVKATGTYEKGKRIGEWKFYHGNGKLAQVGNYKKGKPNGEWEWYYANGSVKRNEYYRKGREDGESIEYDEEGNIVAKGSFVDGLKEGEWYYHVGDHTVKGAYRDGEKHGKWEGLYENGKRQFKGEFSNGLAIGKQKFYFPNGLLKQQGKFNSGRKNGEWRLFTDEGELLLTVKFRNGIETHLEGTKITPTYQELDID